MLVTKKFIYLELQKTGSTYTRNLILNLPSLESHWHGSHKSAFNTHKEVLLQMGFDEKLKIGNIRNPWDWYVSLWAYGCMQKGNAYHRLMVPGNYSLRAKIKNPGLAGQSVQFWKKIYSDPNNAANFRQWLKLLLKSGKMPVMEGYQDTPMARFAGFLTFRFIRLYTKNTNAQIKEISDYQSMQNFYEEHQFMDHILKNEHIIEDLEAIADTCGINKEEIEISANSLKKRSNTSVRNSYASYYDEESRELVADKERFIIDRFQYRFDSE